MIHLEIIDAPDALAIGQYKLYFPRIFIGRSIHNTIPIDHKSIDNRLGAFKNLGNSLTFVTSKQYLVNRKQVSGIIKLKENDIIEIENLIIKVLSYEFSESHQADEYYKYLEEIRESEPAKYKFLTALENHYIQLTGYYDEQFLEE